MVRSRLALLVGCLLAGVVGLARVAQAQAPQAELHLAVINTTARAAAASGTPRADSSARPGDVLEYRITFTNTHAQPVRAIVLNGPMPAGTVLVDGSARAAHAALELSTDGGHTFAAHPMVLDTVNGQRVRRPATAAEITALRWRIEGAVAPGSTVTATYAVRVLDAAHPAPTR